MARAETWSGKEYRGFVYACDMGGVFDVDRFTRCENAICVGVPANASGPAGCGAWLELAELLILRGTWAGGTANFRFGVDVDDVREPGSADTFTITLGTSAASGVLRIGNVDVRSGSR